MKFPRIVALLILMLLYVAGCSDGDNPVAEESGNNETLSSHQLAAGDWDDDEREIMINPNRGYYDIVVVDIDRWEICLNHNRIRNNVTSYHGHLWYQAGRYVFEGTAGAMWYPAEGILTVCALDSGWDRGHILYSLLFEDEEGTDMYGTFVYYEFPRRTNTIDAWLDQGRIGNHDAGPYPGDNIMEHREPRPAGPVKESDYQSQD